MKASELVAGVELVEERVEAGEALVDVLCREVDAVVVVPERAHRLVDVAGRREGLDGESGQRVRVVLVVEEPRIEEVRGEAVALGRRMAVVEMCRDLRDAEAHVIRRQLVVHAHEDRLTVRGMVGRSGDDAVVAPDGVHRQLGMETVLRLARTDLVELLWQEFVPPLMNDASRLAGSRVRLGLRRRRHRRLGLEDGRDRQRRDEGRRGRAARRAGDPRAQSSFRDEQSARRQQSELHQVTPAELRRDQLLPITPRNFGVTVPGHVVTSNDA